MPTYDYKCQSCGHAFEELQSFSAPLLTKCPACKKNKLERLFGGGGAIIFKGSGFYETDYRRTGEKKAEGTEAPAAAAETRGDAKPEAKPAAAPKAEAAPKADTGGSTKPAGGAKKKD